MKPGADYSKKMFEAGS